MPELQIGKYGQIQEWSEDYDEVEPGHRHISQLFALYPAGQIRMDKTPELAQAAKQTIERRLKYGWRPYWMEQGMDHTVLCKTVGERRSLEKLKGIA